MERLDKKIFSTLFFSLFATITGVGIVVPLLPVYAHHLGASGIYIALIFSAFSLSRSVFLPYFGRKSDHIGRKPFIVVGLFCYAVVSVAFILSDLVESLILIRFFQGIASAMIMPVTQAYVGDITPAGSEGFSMGVFNMSVFFGLSLGPLAGGLISDRFNLNTAFMCMGILAMGAFLMALLLLPPTRLEHSNRRQTPPAPWRPILKNREIIGLFVFRFSYTGCIGMIWSFLPVFAASRFSLTSSRIGVLVMLGILISGILQTPMGYFADRLNRKAMVVSGGLLAAVAIFSLSLSGGFWDMFAANLVFGIGGGISMPAVMALSVIYGTKSNAMGSVISLLTMGHSLGMLAGSLAAGAMMDFMDIRQAFLIGSGLMVVGVGVFWLQFRDIA
jgi:MFS family permease